MKAKKIVPIFVLGLLVPLFGVEGKVSNGVEVIGKVPLTTQRKQLPSDLPIYDEPTVQIHYYRADGDYQNWGLWLWAEGKDGAEYEFNYQDSYGGVAYYTLATFNNARSLGFIVKQLFSYAGEGVWNKDGDSDRFMDMDMLIPDDNDSYHVYLNSGDTTVYTNKERTSKMNAVKKSQFENSKKILIEGNNPIKSVVLKKDGVVVSEEPVVSANKTTYTYNLEKAAEITDEFIAGVTFEDGDVYCEKSISIRKLYDAEFDEKYKYDGELGAIYATNETIFRVWSPVSKSITLRLYKTGTPKAIDPVNGDDDYAEYLMEKNETGVFEVTVNGDLEGKYYTYFVKNSSNPDGKEVVDPYAKSAGVNGLRGMVVNFSKANPEGWADVDYLKYDRKQLTVYETHIAELTCSETWGGTPENAKKFKGFYETGTTYTSGNATVKTGFDHIKELGVNAVQIIPFFDQANDETNMTFNWGYNPLNYNVVEGGYSSNPYDGYARIRELKELVKAYNEAGITIIMDVVYNHVNGLSGSNFDVLMPFYYFRYAENGAASNGSGCGNETASDKYMFRKFMIDSTLFWNKEYKIGGFRFDLMGIHDTETMNQLAAKNKEVNPNIVIYGEPWAGGTTALPAGYTAATQASAKSWNGYGGFNDHLRDSMIAGGLAAIYGRQWVTQTKYSVAPNDVATGMKGITKGSTDDVDKAVSYVTCHDNYTMHDRVVAADLGNSDIALEDYKTEDVIEKMNALAYSIVFTSQGTSFMLAGEEMLRTKIVYDTDGKAVNAVNARGEVLNIPAVSGNSYASSYKTNEINYQWKVDHLPLFQTYQKLIALKKSAPGLHAKEPNNVEVLDEGKVIKVTFAGENGSTYIAYHRNGVGCEAKKNTGVNVVTLLSFGLMGCSSNAASEFTVDTTGCTLYMDSLHRELVPGQMTLQPFETLIVKKQWKQTKVLILTS